MEKKKLSGFSGQIGFVLAAAGSAVGIGNLWRFPYLAAKDGGGLFILIYLILVLIFGFTLLITDIAIGRKTGKSAIYAYQSISGKWKPLGVLTFLVPVLIMCYYAVIGGWVSKYMTIYLTGASAKAAADHYFTSFITSSYSPVFFAVLFMLVTALIVYFGVQNGIEKVSKMMMPLMLFIIVGITIYTMTLKQTEGTVTRTGLQGLMIYLTPQFKGLTLGRFLQILLDAMSQLFFSLSVSMGIMITYGSYVNKDVNLSKSVRQIEIFDTSIALLAGAMIVPAIYVFSGLAGMNAGPALMFVSLPKVFYAMGSIGYLIGFAFFFMTALATLTSCISVLESITANCMELFHISRKKITIILTFIYSLISAIVVLGYSIFYLKLPLPNGTTGQILDCIDYLSNSFMMPFISLLSCILIGWIVGPQWIADEVETNNYYFSRKRMYFFVIKYIMPVIMMILFLQSTGILNILA